MRFEFATATRIIFGDGTLAEVPALASQLGTRPLLVTGSNTERAAPLLDGLAQQGMQTVTFSVASEPTTDVVRAATQRAREADCDLVVACGGGSALDTGKAIAALLANGGDPLEYLEVIGQGKTLTRPSAPFVAIPTTAGTGAEVTRNAVLISPEHRAKVSLRSPLMLPTVAVVDPELTHSLPPHITASTGLDALAQVIEPYVSHRANPMTDALCREGMRRAAHSLLRAYQRGDDRQAREDMALTSLLSGFGVANAGLGAVHGFAGPIGGMFAAPHGAVCGLLLPHVMTVNVAALQQQSPAGEALRRYDEMARILTGRASTSASDGVTWAQTLCDELRVPPLASYGITPDDFPVLIDKASRASSMKGNPVELTPEEMREILTRAL